MYHKKRKNVRKGSFEQTREEINQPAISPKNSLKREQVLDAATAILYQIQKANQSDLEKGLSPYFVAWPKGMALYVCLRHSLNEKKLFLKKGHPLECATEDCFIKKSKVKLCYFREQKCFGSSTRETSMLMKKI